MALFGYGMRSKGYKFSGDIAIIIGLAGIPITIFYDKILSWYNEMEYAQISKPWFLKDHMDIYTTFFAIGICFVGILLIIWHNIYRTRSESGRHAQDKTSIGMTSLIAEIKKDETAINVLCAIKTLQDDYQENSEILGQPIHIPESEISKHSSISLGIAQLWISKLTKAHFLKEGFGDIYGVSNPGLEFLHKIGRLK